MLYQEELAWFQRSKAKWLHDRDKITRYCHLKTSRRRRKKAIHMLRNDDGVWIEDEHKVHKLVNSYHQNLFVSHHIDKEMVDQHYSFPPLTQEEYTRLKSPL